MRRSNGRAFAVHMASVDAPLQIGCEVARRRCAFKGWRRGPDIHHPIDQDFLVWEEQMREHRKKEKELSRGQNPREMGKTVLINSKNLGVAINTTLPIGVWDTWLLDFSEENGHILAAAMMFPEYLLDFSSFKNENVL